MPQLPKARVENIVVQELKKELLIYDLISNKALCLNETSKIIWQACDGKTAFDEFRSKGRLDFSDELIWLALDQLNRDDLLDKNIEIDSKFNGLTRREVIRKIGFATMMALPVISSIVAPAALNAQSGCVCVGGSCVTGTCICPSGQVNCSSTCTPSISICFIGGQCFSNGQPGPNVCLVCNTSISNIFFVPAPLGTPCPGGVCNGVGLCTQL